jgi:hypothetical protein
MSDKSRYDISIYTVSSIYKYLHSIKYLQLSTQHDILSFCCTISFPRTNNIKVIKSNFFIIKPTRCTNFQNLLRQETLHVSGSSSAHHQEFIHCTLGTGISQTGLKTAFEQDQDGWPSWSCSKAVYKPIWHKPLLSVHWINSWWWTEELFESCRVSYRSKFGKLVHLVGFITKKCITMYSQVNEDFNCINTYETSRACNADRSNKNTNKVSPIHFLLSTRGLDRIISAIRSITIPVTARDSNPTGGMSWICFVLLGRVLCNGPIPRPEESYRVRCVWVWSGATVTFCTYSE